MKFKPSEILTQQEVYSGLRLVVREGLVTEAMATLTGGAFLVAMALEMGASNFQIGLLAALPTFANIFQLVSIWLLQKFNNRRAIAVIASFFARFPLIIIGVLPFLFSAGTSVQVLIFLLFFHYFLGAVSGANWNSWMKDLVPQAKLGSFFSHRTRLTQIVSVSLSLMVAIMLDYIKSHFPGNEILAYTIMFLIAGVFGMGGVYLLSKTPEPKSILTGGNLFKLIRQPLKDKNFRSLLYFNSFWCFSLNLATPFFSVYLMKSIHLSLSYVIGLNILSQVSGILFIKFWGNYTDRFSNKTIIRLGAPLYVLTLFAWIFTSAPALKSFTIPFLALIYTVSGIAIAGINLAISNISLKLAPKDQAIVYIAARNTIIALFPAIAPLLGGVLADFLTSQQFHFLYFQQWHLFFFTGAVLAILSLRFLARVKEEGEVAKRAVVTEMRRQFRKNIFVKSSVALPGKIYSLAIWLSLKKRNHNLRA
jgi:MFS family permease